MKPARSASKNIATNDHNFNDYVWPQTWLVVLSLSYRRWLIGPSVVRTPLFMRTGTAIKAVSESETRDVSTNMDALEEKEVGRRPQGNT